MKRAAVAESANLKRSW